EMKSFGTPKRPPPRPLKTVTRENVVEITYLQKFVPCIRGQLEVCKLLNNLAPEQSWIIVTCCNPDAVVWWSDGHGIRQWRRWPSVRSLSPECSPPKSNWNANCKYGMSGSSAKPLRRTPKP